MIKILIHHLMTIKARSIYLELMSKDASRENFKSAFDEAKFYGTLVQAMFLGFLLNPEFLEHYKEINLWELDNGED
ncbi:hypothetical protein [Paraburkholderia silvatlantica]|uniref:Phage protein n=1 Tax=Paraburkholderia silvatlantica TaxID=321895 RepID=A0ABR6FYM9_9BURK|nr:hypothetical protein [Paraburkholderia silvatlantica]MBB2932468.1 hypothetical protein [Paraburkholderia silvatlantica]PVY22353.1 hypothetical protein C7411_13257 [Paraburkholderia silvatlantica]PXW27868.1 hypothetical protein C7413_13357 [Paraburkholderia silvatlantica]